MAGVFPAAGRPGSLRFAALQLGADAATIHAYAGRQQTVSEHQQRIGEYLRLRAFDAAAGERLARFLEDEALRLERTANDHREQEDQRNRRGVQHDVLDGMLCPGPGGDHRVVEDE